MPEIGHRTSEFTAMTAEAQKALMSRLTKLLFTEIDEGRSTSELAIAQLGYSLCTDDGWWMYRYAEALRQVGRRAEAEPLLLRSRDIKKNNRYLVEVSLGKLCRDSGRFTEAEQWFRLATETEPGSTAPWVFLGGFLARMQRFADAVSILERGLTASGDVDEVWFNLGLNYRGLGNLKKSRECLLKAMELTPNYTEAEAALTDVERAAAIETVSTEPVATWLAALDENHAS